MNHSKVVSRDEWLSARKQHLKKEKEFTRLRDKLSAERRELPWVKVEKNYVFDGPGRKETLPDLFDGRSQLIVYHFMFGPEWEQGCPSCSFLSDHIDGTTTDMVTEPVDFQPACSTTVRGQTCVRHTSQPRRWSSTFCTRLGAMTSARRKI